MSEHVDEQPRKERAPKRVHGLSFAESDWDSDSDSSTVRSTPRVLPVYTAVPKIWYDSPDDSSSDTSSDTTDDSSDADSSDTDSTTVTDPDDSDGPAPPKRIRFPGMGPIPRDNTKAWLLFHEQAMRRIDAWVQEVEQDTRIYVPREEKQKIAGLREMVRGKRAAYEAIRRRRLPTKRIFTTPIHRVAKKAPVTSRTEEARKSWACRVAEGVSKTEAIRGWAMEVKASA